MGLLTAGFFRVLSVCLVNFQGKPWDCEILLKLTLPFFRGALVGIGPMEHRFWERGSFKTVYKDGKDMLLEWWYSL